MTAIPMTLRDALTYGEAEVIVQVNPEVVIDTPNGLLAVPEMVQSALQHTGDIDDTRPLDWALYLDRIPVFDAAYRPFLLGHILDRFLDQRLAYDTVDQWQTALRRWGNLNMPYFNQLYLSAAAELSLDNYQMSENTAVSGTNERTDDTTENSKTDGTSTSTFRGRDVTSDYPQQQLAGNRNYATDSSDSNNQTVALDDTTESTTRKGASKDTKLEETTRNQGGRNGVSVAALIKEQREVLLNVDRQVLDAMEPLFLQFHDLDEWL